MKQHSPPPLAGRTSPGFILTTLLAWFIWALLPAYAGDPPVIIHQPQSVMVAIGDTLRLSCAVTGTPPIAYIWQRDGVFLGDQTNALLTITNAQPAHSGRYRLTASNDDGLVRSTSADVIVYTNQPCNFPWAWLKAETTQQGVEGLTLDAQGNFYVVGPAYNPASDAVDALTLKLAPDGTILWRAYYGDPSRNTDRALDVCVDAAGNCYVTGSTYRLKPPNDGDEDYLTIKYDSFGSVVWMAIYNSTTNKPNPNASSDHADQVVVDGAGYVYVSGYSGTLKYDPQGIPVWTNSFGGRWLRFLPGGSGVLVAPGPGGANGAVAKLDSTGVKLWETQVEGLHGLAVDGEGCTYVIGAHGFNWQASTGDIETVKLSPDGQRVWTAIYSSSSGLRDEPGPITVDYAGNILVAGMVYRTNSPLAQQSGKIDLLVLKYSSAGALVWSRVFNDAADMAEIPSAIATDSAGAVYVAASSGFVPGGEGREGLLLKYDQEGNLLWTSRYRNQGQRAGQDYYTRLAVGAEGRLTIAGTAVVVNRFGDAQTEWLVAGYDQTTPRLAMAGVPAPGVRQGCLVSPRQSVFDILGTTNLSGAAWQPIGTVTNFNGLVPFYDRDAGQHPMRFYRAQEVSP